jgi:hypothetical protein
MGRMSIVGIRTRIMTALTGAAIASLALSGFAAAASELSFSTFGETQAVGPGTYRLISDASPGYGGLDFNLPAQSIEFADISVLRTTAFADPDDTCRDGSPRFQINVDKDGDGDFDANAFAYVEIPGQLCPVGGDTGNLAQTGGPGDLLLRWDTSQLMPGTQITTYTATAALFLANPNWSVIGIQLVVDAGYAFPDGEQAVRVNPDVEVDFGVPTSADDCKNGGWQSRSRADGSAFRNQGECIKYVNTGN